MEEAPYDYGEGGDPEVYPVFRIACLDVGVDLMQSLDCFLVEQAYTEMKNSSIENQKTSRMLQADIKKFGALVDKLDRLLSQRKLNDYK